MYVVAFTIHCLTDRNGVNFVIQPYNISKQVELFMFRFYSAGNGDSTVVNGSKVQESYPTLLHPMAKYLLI